MKLSSLRYAAILVTLLAGCGTAHDCYEIEVRPDGEAFQRKLTCWHIGGKENKEITPLSADRLAAIAKLYPPRETPDDAKKHVFTGRFTGNTPADVGGAGSYSYFPSSLGNTSSYVERFRGNDDVAAQLAKRRESADHLADLLLGWMTAELGRHPNFAQLRTFLDEDVRRDLRNLALYLWTYQATEDLQSPPNGEFLVWAGQYFSERGYFSPQEIPMLVRTLWDDDPKPLLAHVRRFLARKMGTAADQPIPASLDFLADLPRLKASFDKYAQSSELLQKRLEAWKSQQKDKKDKADSEETTLSDVTTDLVLELVGMEINIFGGPSDSLDLKLFCGEKPYATNGKWDEKSAAVSWSKSVGPNQTPPVVYFALWSTPDDRFQETHFGKVLLTGGDLAEYVIWYRSLKPEETREWDRFISGLKPGPDLVAAVKAFRFSTDPKVDPNKPDAQAASLADTPRSLILERLEAKPGGTE